MPFTLALINNSIRLTLIGLNGQKMMNYILSEVKPEQLIYIGKHKCTVQSITLDNEFAPGFSTIADISAPPFHHKFTMIFRTETAISKLNARGQRYMKLFPDPELVFTSLANYWQSYMNEMISEWFIKQLANGSIVTSKYKLKTCYFRQGKRHQNGFQGAVDYICLNHDKKFIETTNKLCRFAPYVGLGVQTARGMGAVSVNFVQ